MKVFKAKDGYLIRLERGEEIHGTLLEFARDKGLRGGVVQGIGAVADTEAGLYRTELRGYERFQIPEVCELLSLNGNFCLLEGVPFLHAHVVLMNADREVSGGHLFRATIAVTGEFFVGSTDLRLTRVHDSEVNLSLLELE